MFPLNVVQSFSLEHNFLCEIGIPLLVGNDSVDLPARRALFRSVLTTYYT
jgi:hypothetical protein